MPDTESDSAVTRARAHIAEIRRLHDRLATRAAGMSADDLRHPSACSDWDVSQVLSHLGSSSEIGLAGIDAASLGEPAPDQEFSKAVWARWDGSSPEERRNEWQTWSERYVHHLESRSDDQLAALSVQPFWAPQPLDAAELTGGRLVEVALHTWDVEVSFDAAAVIDDLAAELVLPRLPGVMRWAGKPERWTGAPATLQVQTTSPESAWELAAGSDAVTLTPADPFASADLSLPAETLIRLIAGRFRDDDATRVSGTADLTALRAVFPGF